MNKSDIFEFISLNHSEIIVDGVTIKVHFYFIYHLLNLLLCFHNLLVFEMLANHVESFIHNQGPTCLFFRVVGLQQVYTDQCEQDLNWKVSKLRTCLQFAQ